MWLVSIAVAVLFVLAILILFPLIAAAISGKEVDTEHDIKIPNSIDILVPCHNEKGRVELTLKSIVASVAAMKALFPSICVNIFCGIDTCNDGSEEEVEQFQITVKKFNFKSKWMVINALFKESTADWIILADCGVIWDERLLRNAVPHLSCPDVVGFSPSYASINGTLISRIYWQIEAFIKSLENKSGGPVSVHGATVMYERRVLKNALQLLAGRNWINDDVVIPLIIRATNLDKRIIYSRNKKSGFVVCDLGVRTSKSDRHARSRVSAGNLQWIKYLAPIVAFSNKVVFLLCLRRVFRVFWFLIPVTTLFGVVSFIFKMTDHFYIQSFLVLFAIFILFLLFKIIPGFSASLISFMSFISGREVKEIVRWR